MKLNKFRVKALVHKKIAGSELDGSDWVCSKGEEKTVVITYPGEIPQPDRIARILASRRLQRGMFISRILEVELV